MSKKIQAIYQTRKELIMKRFRVTYIVANISVFLPQMVPWLCPILYIGTGYPSPNKWYTPFGFEDA